MFSLNFMDLLTDKLLPTSVKMKERSFTRSDLRLLSDIPNFHSQHTRELMDVFFDNSILCNDLEVYNSVQRTKVESPLVKNLLFSSVGLNKFSFSPHIYSFIDDNIRFLTNQSDMLFSPSNLNIASVLRELSQSDPTSTKQLSPNPNKNSENTQSNNSSVEREFKISMTVKNKALKAKSTLADDKHNMPNSVTLSLELANRKTKELQKRSKKRRRRQKKGQRTDVGSPELLVVDETKNNLKCSPKSSHKSNSKSPQSDKGFVVSVEHVSPSLMSSFVISVENISGSDSDWDACSESDVLTEVEDFEFTGLFLTNLSSSKVCFHTPFARNVTCDLTAYSPEEADEVSKSQAILMKVNKNWNEATKEVNSHPKSPSKVSFAPDNQLTKVFPVEFCERKGEWEIYANERLRFKRRIDELEKIISPCLAAEHRLAVYKNIVIPTL